MATATAARRDVKTRIHVPLGRRRPQQPPGARRVARRVGNGRHDQPAAPGHPRRQDQAPDVPRRPRGQREGHHVLHAPARDDATAGVPLLQAFDIVARGHSNARFSRLMMDIKSQVEAGLEPVAGVPRAPEAFRRAVLQPRAAPAKPPACSTRSSTASRPTRKRSSRSRARSSRRCSIRSRSSSSRSSSSGSSWSG